MANTVQKTKILDGSVVAFHFYLQSDGVAGELVNYTLIDPATDLDPVIPPGRDLTLDKIFYEVLGFSLRFSFDGGASGPWPVWLSAPSSSVRQDFSSFGGLRDRSGGASGLNATGKLLLDTNGFTNQSARASFVLELKRAR